MRRLDLARFSGRNEKPNRNGRTEPNRTDQFQNRPEQDAEPNRTEPDRATTRPKNAGRTASNRENEFSEPNRTEPINHSKCPEPNRNEPNWFLSVFSVESSRTRVCERRRLARGHGQGYVHYYVWLCLINVHFIATIIIININNNNNDDMIIIITITIIITTIISLALCVIMLTNVYFVATVIIIVIIIIIIIIIMIIINNGITITVHSIAIINIMDIIRIMICERDWLYFFNCISLTVFREYH